MSMHKYYVITGSKQQGVNSLITTSRRSSGINLGCLLISQEKAITGIHN